MRQGVRVFVAIVVMVTGASNALRGAGPTILFNPFGNVARGRGSPTRAVDTLDVAVGNALLVGFNANSAVGSVASLLFQANLVIATLAGNPVFTFGSGGTPSFTVVARFNVRVVQNVAGALVFAAPLPSRGSPFAQGFFKIYRHASNGNNLAGTCFASDCGGTSVLQGKILSNANLFGNLFTKVPTPAQALNQFGAIGQSPVNSLAGNGSLRFDIAVTGVDSLSFPNLAVGTSSIHAIAQLSLPFKQLDPSACFSTDGITGCNQAGVGSVGAVNGQGANTMVQADASLSF